LLPGGRLAAAELNGSSKAPAFASAPLSAASTCTVGRQDNLAAIIGLENNRFPLVV